MHGHGGGSPDEAGWETGGQSEPGGLHLSVRLRHTWILFLRNEGPVKTFCEGCGVTKAAILSVVLEIDACVKVDEEGKEADGCGKTCSEAMETV